jgi:hypothetical protein
MRIACKPIHGLGDEQILLDCGLGIVLHDVANVAIKISSGTL